MSKMMINQAEGKVNHNTSSDKRAGIHETRAGQKTEGQAQGLPLRDPILLF